MNPFNSNILRTILPFYPSLDHQNRNKAWCHDKMRMFKLISSTWRFLPFQIVRNTDPATAYTWELYLAYDDSFYMTINFPPGQIDTATKGGYDYITYFGTEDFFSEMECGKFYIYWTDGNIERFSEVFTIEDFTDDTTETYIKYGLEDDLIEINVTDILKTK